jgi:LPXTG-site transpeptidase (sortase) family protein
VTAETPEAPARPDPGQAAPAETVARGVVRLGAGAEPAARGRASVPGAISPALRHAPAYVPPPRRERPRAQPPAEPVAREVAPPAPAPEAAEAAPDAVRTWPPAAEPPVPADVKSAPDWPLALSEMMSADGDPSTGDPAPNHDVRDEPKVRRRGRGVLLPLVAGLLAAFVAGTGYLAVTETPVENDKGRWAGSPPAAVPDSAAEDAPDDAPFAVPAEGNAADPFGVRAQTVTGPPTRLKIKAIGVDTALETLRLGGDGALIPPKNFAKAGFYADGTMPGDTGPAVIAGHVDSKRGPAVFYDLREMQSGDKIQVVRGGRTLTFTVTRTAWYPKNKFPVDEVYGPTPDRQLRLITCGGVFDRSLRSYKDNLVVYAVAG